MYKVLSHSLRREILLLLNKESKLSVTELMDKLSIDDKEQLELHLEILGSLITRDKNFYFLTENGQRIVKIMILYSNILLGKDIPKKAQKLEEPKKILIQINKEFEQKLKEGIKKLLESKGKLKTNEIESKFFTKIKNDFITLVAHEIKTPLISIFGYIDYILLKYENLDLNLKEDLIIVHRNIKRLWKLLDQTLEVLHISYNN